MRDSGGRARRDASLRDAVHGTAEPGDLSSLRDAADVVVDARGTFCPEPVIRIQEAVRKMAARQVVVLEADDAGVEVDIPAWCMSTGNEYLGILRDARVYRVLVRKA